MRVDVGFEGEFFVEVGLDGGGFGVGDVVDVVGFGVEGFEVVDVMFFFWGGWDGGGGRGDKVIVFIVVLDVVELIVFGFGVVLVLVWVGGWVRGYVGEDVLVVGGWCFCFVGVEGGMVEEYGKIFDVGEDEWDGWLMKMGMGLGDLRLGKGWEKVGKGENFEFKVNVESELVWR